MQPEYRLRGKNVGWMPGYWSWDDQRKKHIWTSGFWRLWPPDRDYVPGYWEQVDGGWRWISGFWIKQASEEIRYLPKPPKSLEAGPTSLPPSTDQIWMPGRYVWNETGFGWRNGFWAKARLGWIWNPAYNVWTPAGVVHVDGYWDFPAEQRALLFAPVAIPPDVLAYPNFYYRPRVVIDVQALLAHLFCQTAGSHYCFGNYYGTTGDADGIYPWFAFHLVHGYDPLVCVLQLAVRSQGLELAGTSRKRVSIPERSRGGTAGRDVPGTASKNRGPTDCRHRNGCRWGDR